MYPLTYLLLYYLNYLELSGCYWGLEVGRYLERLRTSVFNSGLGSSSHVSNFFPLPSDLGITDPRLPSIAPFCQKMQMDRRGGSTVDEARLPNPLLFLLSFLKEIVDFELETFCTDVLLVVPVRYDVELWECPVSGKPSSSWALIFNKVESAIFFSYCDMKANSCTYVPT